MYLLEILWKPESQVLSAMATVLLLTLYAMDGWFFGYYNTKLRRRYAKLFGCWSKEVEPLRGGDNAGGGDPGTERRSGQQGAGSAGRPRRARVGAEMTGGPGAAGNTGEGGTGTCGTIWVVPRATEKTAGAPAAAQDHLDTGEEMTPKDRETNVEDVVPKKTECVLEDVASSG